MAARQSTTRRLLSGQTGYHVASALDVAGGVRVENEHGSAASPFGRLETDRNNYGAFVEARAAARAVFGYATTPRVSVSGRNGSQSRCVANRSKLTPAS